MLSRLGSIDRRYQELLELSKLRKQRLEDASALYQLFNEADGTEQWIAEKVSAWCSWCFGVKFSRLDFVARAWLNILQLEPNLLSHFPGETAEQHGANRGH